MSTPSRSRSSAMGSEGYFNKWENMERCQQESERQVWSLLRETRRLKKENDVLRAQVSSSGPSHSWQPKSQWTNSNLNDEVFFPKNTKFHFGSQEIRLDEKFSPTHQALLDESSDSTRLSTKRRRGWRSQLSNMMRAWLRPQTLGMEGRPWVATTQKVCHGPSPVVVMLEWHFYPPVQQVRVLIDRGLPHFINRRLDDMFSKPFSHHIINYEPSRRFMVLKFKIYDGTSDPFDHIMHYKYSMIEDDVRATIQ